jgi:hypothetical protein
MRLSDIYPIKKDLSKFVSILILYQSLKQLVLFK